jgi:hypothetical protein
MGDLGRIIPIDVSIRDLDSIRHAMSRSNIVINCVGKYVQWTLYQSQSLPPSLLVFLHIPFFFFFKKRVFFCFFFFFPLSDSGTHEISA